MIGKSCLSKKINLDSLHINKHLSNKNLKQMIIFIEGSSELQRADLDPNDKNNKTVQGLSESDISSLSLNENNIHPIIGNKNISELGITKGTTLYLHCDVIK